MIPDGIWSYRKSLEMITISVDMNDYFPNLFQSQLFKAITTMYCGDHNKCKSEMNDSDRVR